MDDRKGKKHDYQIPANLLFIAQDLELTVKDICAMLEFAEQHQKPFFSTVVTAGAAKKALEKTLKKVKREQYMEGFDLIDTALEKDEIKPVSEYLEERINFLKSKIKEWPSDSSVARCAQARLYEIKKFKERYYPDE